RAPPVDVQGAHEVTEAATRVVRESEPGFRYAGHVSIADTWKTHLIAADAEGLALAAAGNLQFDGYVADTTLAGDVEVGGSLRADGRRLVIQGDLRVRGDMTLGQ
ncbi:hypothetical protein, partial [Paenibacillus sp. 598K]|uniref:hypothetical protein n=1 Tax=Paenibacillus sp. 598K TaxID=1117987 RepID=UPI001625AEF4